MNFRFTLALALFFTALTHAAIVEPLEQECVLDSDGHQTCILSPEISDVQSTASVVRKSSPCARKDIVCWCKKTLEYTNNVRKKKGLSMLSLGPKQQMANAMRYAKKLGKMGYLKHQNLRSVTKEVGCKRWVGGENLAFNYETGDIARKCVDQWIKSKGHYQNLVRSWYKEMVVGFYFAKDGRVYCVQTFGMYYPRQTFGSRNGPKCNPVA